MPQLPIGRSSSPLPRATMSTQVFCEKFPSAREMLPLIWLWFAACSVLSAGLWTLGMGFWALCLSVSGMLGVWFGSTSRMEFGRGTVRECKLLLGVVCISTRVLARLGDSEQLYLRTRPGPSHDDGTPWLDDHELLLFLKDGSRLVLQRQCLPAITRYESELIEQCHHLARSLAVPFIHDRD